MPIFPCHNENYLIINPTMILPNSLPCITITATLDQHNTLSLIIISHLLGIERSSNNHKIVAWSNIMILDVQFRGKNKKIG